MFVSAALVLLAAAATPVPENSAEAAPAAQPVKEKKICMMQEAVTGSITPRRTCKTKAEWDALMGRAGPATDQQRTVQQSAPGGR